LTNDYLPSCKSFVRARLPRGYPLLRNRFIVKTKLLPKDLKPLRVAVFILSVFLVGCASTRQASTQSHASDDIGQPHIGVILSLTDFHFDPFYDPKLFHELVQSPPSEWTRIFAGSQVSGYGQYGKDSNYNLFVSALKHAALAAPKAAFILLAGDWLAHGLSDTYYHYAGRRDPQGLYEFIDKTITFLTQRIREQFPDIPIYPVLGNEDSYCGDYHVQPEGEFLRRRAETWKVLFHNGRNERAFMQTFPTGGYYAVARPGTPQHRIVVLNTVFFAADYRNQCGNRRDDPAGDQLHWLAAQLKEAAAKGDKVWLLYLSYSVRHRCVQHCRGDGWEHGRESHSSLASRPPGNLSEAAQPVSQHDPVHLGRPFAHGRVSTGTRRRDRPLFELFARDSGHQPRLPEQPGTTVLTYNRRTFSLLDYTTDRLDLAAGPRRNGRRNTVFPAPMAFPP
jgi:Calcineurin-like phosphoesterase